MGGGFLCCRLCCVFFFAFWWFCCVGGGEGVVRGGESRDDRTHRYWSLSSQCVSCRIRVCERPRP